MSPINHAVQVLESQAALAECLGVKQQNVWNWIKRGDRVPAQHCPAIERATQARVTCEQLRPDVSWSRIADTTWPHPGGRPVIDVARADAAPTEATA